MKATISTGSTGRGIVKAATSEGFNQKVETKATISTNAGGKGSVSISTFTSNYEALGHKPSINGVVLNGNLTTASLGIIDDNTITDIATWSSEQIEKRLKENQVVSELTGTILKPIIASELSLGSFIISGQVQSSRENATFFTVPRKQYSVNRTVDGATILWEENPYTFTRYYITFFHTGEITPQENTVELVTKHELETMAVDGGTF